MVLRGADAADRVREDRALPSHAQSDREQKKDPEGHRQQRERGNSDRTRDRLRKLVESSVNPRIPRSPPMQLRITSSMSDAPTPRTPCKTSTAKLVEATVTMAPHAAGRRRSQEA